jgi:trimethylamine--corrinoid protein Co-methyltransferase
MSSEMNRKRRKSKGQSEVKNHNLTKLVNDKTFSPIEIGNLRKISDSAIRILSEIGMSDAPEELCDLILEYGGKLEGKRLLYPTNLIESTIKRHPRVILLAGQTTDNDLQVGGNYVYAGTGGAAPNLQNHKTKQYVPSKLKDLYDAARLADKLPNISFFSRSLVAGDIENPLDFDLSTAAASLAGTSKHVMVQAAHFTHVKAIAELCYQIAGGEENFRKRPFLSLHINHAVPPLRFDPENVKVMIEAVKLGIPVHCNVFGQLGASSPVTIAGSVSQTIAETLAGLVLVNILNPKASSIAGPRPMITDLRTGGMAGGAPEQIMATGIAVQVLRNWEIPCSVIAGATDSKLIDFQSGYEKALTINSAAQTGANLITQAAGSQASLMGINYGAMVADNELIGAIFRSNIIPEVSDETLMHESIREVVNNEGHYLGHPETYARMKSDFYYPEIAERKSLEEWADSDQLDMGQRADYQASKILKEYWPNHLSRETTDFLSKRFPLDLNRSNK